MKKTNPPLYNQTLVNTGNGSTVILLHGLFGNYRMWSKIVDSLKNDFHVVVPRLPIFELPVHLTNIKYLAKVLDEFIEYHEFNDITLVGHAIGGQVALMYAHSYPEKVSKLVLTGSTGLLETPLTDESLVTKDINYKFVENMVNRAFHNRTPFVEYFAEEIYLTVQNIPKRLSIGSMIKSSNQNNVTSFLNEISHPTLLLWGLEDKFSPPEIALHFHDYMRNSELKFIKECGHVVMVDKPEEFSQHLIPFLKKIK